MITLKNIADLFISDFSGGKVSKDSTISPQDVIKKARAYANTVLKPVIWEKLDDGDKSALTQAIYQYELSLQTDAEGKYIAIPDFYMALRDNRGVHRIYVKGNNYSDFVPQNNPGISSDLPHAKMKSIQYYWIVGLKARMGKGCIAKKGDTMILQIINIAPDALGENDPLPIMPEQLAELMRLLKMDFAPTAGIQTDYLNNQNSNIR